MNIFVLFLLAYLVYRFIGGFLIPLFRTSRHMRGQFQEMKRPPNGQADQSGPANTQKTESPKAGSSKLGEYIDFEEVK